MDFSTLNGLESTAIAPAPDTTGLDLPGAMAGMPSASDISWDGSTSVPIGSQSDSSGSNIWDALQSMADAASSVATQIQGSPTPGVPPAQRPVVTSANSGASAVKGLFTTNTMLAVGVGAGALILLAYFM